MPWEKLQTPTSKTLSNLYFINNEIGWFAGEGGTIVHTSDGGQSWILQDSNVETFIVDIFFLNENKGWALTFSITPPFGTTILNTTNGGEDWTTKQFPDSNAVMNTIFFFDSLNGWIGGSYIAGTTDGGNTWVEAEVDSNMVSGFPVYNFEFLNNQFGYACGGFIDVAGVIWKTTNYGQSWSAQGISPDEIFDLFIFDSLNAVTLSGDPEGLFPTGNIRTTNAGLNWSYDTLSTFGLSFAIDFRTAAEGWSASGFKFLKTDDAGVNWRNVILPDSITIYDLTFTDSHTGFASGENGIVLKYIPNPNSVEEIRKASAPDEFTLYQNYPNPFNNQTKIEYDLISSGFVKLTVYDNLGRVIQKPVDEYQTSGHYSRKLSFNSSVPGGIYFYHLETNGLFKTRKMVYLK